MSVFACTACGNPAPPLDSPDILAWQDGELAAAGEADPTVLTLVCPECLQETRPDESELGGGD